MSRGDHNSANRRAALGNESGFGLIEIIVVLVIVAILFGMAIGSMRGSKQAVASKDVETVANAYNQSIAAFAVDHGGRVPVPTAPADWVGDIKNGPAQPVTDPVTGKPRRYLQRTPDSVASGRVQFVTAAPGFTSSLAGFALYVPEAGARPVRYRIETWVPNKGRTAWELRCWSGSLTTTAGPKC